MSKEIPSSIVIATSRTDRYRAVFLPEPGASAEIRDFTTFLNGKQPENKTALRLSWDTTVLRIEADCLYAKPGMVRSGNTRNGMSVWSGDELEFFFGAISPEYHQRQICVGAGGGRFDSFGKYDEWSAETRVEANSWHAVIRLPLTMLHLKEMKLLFNAGRQTLYCSEYVSWCSVRTGFDEMAEFGELFFCSPDQAYFILTGVLPKNHLTADTFETVIAEHLIPAGTISDPPVLIQPRIGQVSVVWRTAGPCGARLEYRKKGATDWIRAYSSLKHGILDQRNRFHRAELTGLESGAAYEYRLVSVPQSKNASERIYPEQGFCTFTAPAEKPGKLSFLLVSDVHSQMPLLEQWSKLGKDCDFMVELGDFLANRICMNNFYAGFLSLQGKNNPEQPLVLLKGNHEQDGMSAADYRALAFSSGKSYDCFTMGNVCFLALDSGDDHDDGYYNDIRVNHLLLEEEEEWLRGMVKSEAWLRAGFRIVFVHIPPFSKKRYEGQQMLRLLDPLNSAEIKPDLMLCGHLHEYGRQEHGRITVHVPENAPALSDPDDIPELPYPVICNSNNSAVHIVCRDGQLSLHTYGEDGSVIDSVEIR